MHDPDRYRPTERFGDRVDDYRRYRPGYPPALTRWLLDEAGLVPGDAVADIGSGTGLLSRDLLAAGLQVKAVEPNAAMRAAAEVELASFAGFNSVAGTAEATGLQAASVRLLTAAQAFHWFVPLKARAEAQRVLAPGGAAALIWNVRRLDGAFAIAYEDLLMRRCPDYAAGQPHQASIGEIGEFFGDAKVREAHFDYVQQFDFDGLKGRLLSSSYTPKTGDAAREPLLTELRTIFDAHQQRNAVAFEYDCRAYLATMA
ncbi:class I SAM-dependent methyltransferase [uncultured Nevskia sp.]|uniref:class I SAM-dependent methyltransferase n=1 Tax=uncultured Nevskia sp. TaxID=228950 RepID=UPI0025E09BBC|nr:class I SAM-dependent methyltransferase [uncultured Nevskia sp.]